VFGVALFSNHDPIFPTPLRSPSVCNAEKYHPSKIEVCDP